MEHPGNREIAHALELHPARIEDAAGALGLEGVVPSAAEEHLSIRQRHQNREPDVTAGIHLPPGCVLLGEIVEDGSRARRRPAERSRQGEPRRRNHQIPV